jgi:hypothetical protein
LVRAIILGIFRTARFDWLRLKFEILYPEFFFAETQKKMDDKEILGYWDGDLFDTFIQYSNFPQKMLESQET